jgi:CheY-like chemotaxis protein/AraC-like DNA-binding protein
VKILVVEDEQLALEDLLDMLRPLAASHSIVGCTSGAEALAHAERCPPDLVITDIRMPGMDGLELLRRLKAGGVDLAALVLSGHSEFEYAREGVRLGITDYLLKPVRTETLLQTVAAALAALAEERAHAGQLREARLVRLLLGGPRAAEADPELLAGPWGAIVTVCENWESQVVWRDTPVGRETLARALAQEGLAPCDIVGIDGHIRVLLAPTVGASPHALEFAARRVQREAAAAGVVAHSTYALKAADESPAGLVPEALRRLGQGMRFAGPTLLGPEPAADAGPAAREQLQLAERALADGRQAAAAAQLHAALAQLRQDRATQMGVVEALDGFFQLFQRHLGPGQAEPLPDRAALAALLRRLRTYDELATWVDLQLQPLLDAQRGAATPRQLVRTLVARVQNDYAGEISLQAFAAEHGVSLAYFSRLFKDEVGVTFSDYLTRIRVERAKELLARGDLRPADVSALVGYEDPKYFGQIFRRAAGMSPLDYQRSRQREA